MPFLYKKEEGRDYRRYKHTADEQRRLRSKGFTPVVSSNVSAIAQDGKALIVRFLDSATYSYPKSGELFQDMLDSGSKGKFVWKYLVRARVPYKKVSGFKLGIPIEDEAPQNLMAQAKEETSIKASEILAGLALATMIDINNVLQTETLASLALANFINGNAPKIAVIK